MDKPPYLNINALYLLHIEKKHITSYRYQLLLAITLLICACTPSSTSEKIPTVAIVNINPNLKEMINGFNQALTDQGYIADKNIRYIRYEIKPNELEETLKKVLAQDIDLLYTPTTKATLIAKHLTKDSQVPVIFSPVHAPVEAGVVDSIIHPGGNLTGVQVDGSNAKALEFLLNVKPETKNILVLTRENGRPEIFCLSELRQAADKLRIELVVMNTQTRSEINQALTDIPNEIDALWLLHSPFLIPNSDLFLEAAIQHKIPLVSGAAQVNAGVMISYGQNLHQTGVKVGRLAHQILQGAKPSELPVETTDFFVAINLKTAHQAGINIPYEVTQQANIIVYE